MADYVFRLPMMPLTPCIVLLPVNDGQECPSYEQQTTAEGGHPTTDEGLVHVWFVSQ